MISVPFSVKHRIIDEHNLDRRVWQLASDGLAEQTPAVKGIRAGPPQSLDPDGGDKGGLYGA